MGNGGQKVYRGKKCWCCTLCLYYSNRNIQNPPSLTPRQDLYLWTYVFSGAKRISVADSSPGLLCPVGILPKSLSAKRDWRTLHPCSVQGRSNHPCARHPFSHKPDSGTSACWTYLSYLRLDPWTPFLRHPHLRQSSGVRRMSEGGEEARRHGKKGCVGE